MYENIDKSWPVENWDELIPSVQHAELLLRAPADMVKRAILGAGPTVVALCPTDTSLASVWGDDRAVSNLGFTLVDADWDDPRFVKVAMSPALRSFGEKMQLLSGDMSVPGPVAAGLAAILLGAGLGYGVSRVGKALLPRGYGDKLPRTGALLGAAAGATVPAAWAATNAAIGKPWYSGDLGNVSPDDPDGGDPTAVDSSLRDRLIKSDPLRIDRSPFRKRSDSQWAADMLKVGDMFNQPMSPRRPGPADVNVDALGRLLWSTHSTDPNSGVVAGVMATAAQYPDMHAPLGYVTGHQLGQMAMSAGTGYLSGVAGGILANKIIGTPWSAGQFGAAGAVAGLASTFLSSFR